MVNNQPVSTAFPNVTMSWNESEIGVAHQQPCPCAELLSFNSTSSRMCGGDDTRGAQWEPVGLVDCGLTNIGLSLCQSRMVR